MVCDGPLVVLRGVYLIRDSRVLVSAEVVASRLLGVAQELPGKQGLHLQDGGHRNQRKALKKNFQYLTLQIVFSERSKQYRKNLTFEKS